MHLLRWCLVIGVMGWMSFSIRHKDCKRDCAVARLIERRLSAKEKGQQSAGSESEVREEACRAAASPESPWSLGVFSTRRGPGRWRSCGVDFCEVPLAKASAWHPSRRSVAGASRLVLSLKELTAFSSTGGGLSRVAVLFLLLVERGRRPSRP